ncbi:MULTISPECIES: hypothetical protein [unclassified Bradyrhizobium]|uniref:hypothetical protein n=1 Tax=unclassified Bradyrhizobium TaxID=2631580 RepID=UPI001FFB697D|nr:MULTISPECIES: hypothetical protein [unclassified Bradyrhizobium]MCK1707622.1 hypothetical protein [Bradyrhizobium sp. 143]MCK1724833.1 hypothetical protein [Bradyrhizobium sp. 142]
MTRPDPQIVKAKKREIQVRHRNGRKFSMAPVRVAEFDRLLDHRYGRVLPDDDAGREDAKIMVHHLVQIGGTTLPHVRAGAWLARRAPWMRPAETEALVAAALAKPLRYRADTMGKLVRLTWAERKKLKIGTIWAFDITRAEAAAEIALIKRKARRDRRRAKGVKPRHEYEAAAIGHGKPWIAQGVSKATWYRQQAKPALQ